MKNELFEWRGVEGLVAAEVISDTKDALEFGEVFDICGIAELGRTTENSSETKYYDNVPALVLESTGADTVTCSVSGIPLDVLAKITGQIYDDTLGAFIEGERNAKYFALGYKTKKTNGNEVYVWRYKGKFSIPDSTHSTQTAGTESNGQEITYTGISTTYKFAKTNRTAKAVNIDTVLGKADVEGFFDKVTTIDDLVALFPSDIVSVAHPTTDFFGKKANEFISDDVKIHADGKVTGTLKYVTDYTEFGAGDLSEGNYFPFRLSKKGTTMSILGGATPKENIGYDPDVILKVNDYKKFTIKVDGEVVINLDFTETTLANN